MSKTLYLECQSGISGDMFVAAMLDLGADSKKLTEVLNHLPADGFQIEIGRKKKSGIEGCDFHVVLDEKHENHDHDMEYLHSPGYGEEGLKSEHVHEHHDHQHRNLSACLDIIDHSQLTDHGKAIASNIFRILAQAEAKAHGESIETVHFHEVGAIDSIADICAAAFCLDDLKIEEVIIPNLCEGKGTVRCQHGILPVPVPAVLNIVQQHHLTMQLVDVEGELVTPTGAAIAAAICTSRQLPKTFEIQKIGIGLGKRQYERPSILRAMLIHSKEEGQDQICKLEANIDDAGGEVLGYTMECLFQAGAKDVAYFPIYMKKNRPAYQLNVICDEKDREKLEEIIFRETTTIGIRRVEMKRTTLERKIERVETEFGTAKIKICQLEREQFAYPEYESVKEISRKHGMPYREIYEIICRKWKDEHEK